ncbi:von Willebrand factor A-like protein [Gracilaria domingensis]|nr:von Willebrand factor A-like protein [Gracilaria domingensis]
MSLFQAAIDTERIFYESTNISNALSVCQEQLRSAEGNKTIVLVSDGQTSPAEEERTEAVVQQIKSAGINMITAGIGCDANEDFLKEIATSPELFINLNEEHPCGDAMNALESICEPEDCPPQETTGPCVPISCQEAFNRCAFTFAGKNGLATFDATSRPDVSFTPMIISKNPNVHIGVLNMNDLTPVFIEEDGVTEITRFGSQRFTRTHFKPFSIEGTRGSGIGHQTYHGNQMQLARNRCIRVSFSQVQLLDNTEIVAGNLNDAPENHCVVFRTN